jgi:hypothetical protein
VRRLTARLKRDGHIAEEELPGAHRQSDEQLRDFVRDHAWGYHACGTCAIGAREPWTPRCSHASRASSSRARQVYRGPSWLDGKDCIVLDYSETSLLAQWIRDEIRQIEPGLYLGKVYWNKKRLIDFALKF